MASLLWTAQRSDNLSVDRQIQMARHALDTSVDQLVRQQRTVAVWDFAVLELNKPSPDWQWVDDWVGVWLFQMFSHDQVFILDPAGEPVYAVIAGARVPASHYYAAQFDLRTLIEGLQKPDHEHAGRPSSKNVDAPLLDKVVSHAHFLEVYGRPAIASAIKVVPLTDAVTQQAGTEFTLVSIRFIAGEFLSELSKGHLIREPRLSEASTASPDERVLPLLSDDGELITYFVWWPELPGTATLRVLGPIAALIVSTLVLMMVLLCRWLWRTMSRLEATVVELQSSEAHAQHLASHDVLTGLPNRSLFDERFAQALSHAHTGEGVALLVLDLDDFKRVNDTLGHLAGDELIRKFALRLSGLLRGSDTVARLGGDEFAVVVRPVGNKSELETLCAGILEMARQPFDLQGRQAFVSASVGIARAPETGCDPVELLRRADIALYHAKASGRGRWLYFTPMMDESVKLRSIIEADLRMALADGNELQVYYQPQVSASRHQVVGLEALVRWVHPTHGLILPSQFIPVAEGTGLIVPLGEWVLQQACAVSMRFPDVFVAVNLSPVQLRFEGGAARVIGIVRESGADPSRIELEVTEGVLLDESRTNQDALRTLRDAGFRIALDDFGTGYSSLSYLRRFEVDKIKIDRSFVQHLGRSAETGSLAIVEAITTLGRAFGLAVTAEGVETEEQRQILTAAGCTELQGYLFSRPIPEKELARLIPQQEFVEQF